MNDQAANGILGVLGKGFCVTLINCDKKIITKVMNNRLALILPSIIHHNQTGFIPNRDLRTNVRTCISLTQYAKKHNIDLTLMAVDVEMVIP